MTYVLPNMLQVDEMSRSVVASAMTLGPCSHMCYQIVIDVSIDGKGGRKLRK